MKLSGMGAVTCGMVLVLAAACAAPPPPAPAPAATATPDALAQRLAAFEVELGAVRQELKIPGMSAAIVKDGRLAWARGFGFADLENRLPAAPETPYHLASVTKPFAALVVMQLVQDGKLRLDDPVARYGVSLPEGEAVTVRHLLSHTSAGAPGARYRYDGARYGLLSRVIQAASGRSLQEWLFERILQPLGMDDTAPSPAGCAGLPFAPACQRVYQAIARPYMLDGDMELVAGSYQTTFDAAAGLISTVLDLAKLDAALDADTLVTAATKEQMFTPTVSTLGQDLPYGLGWFTQRYGGSRLVWHYGHWAPSVSALFVKLPEIGLTFIALANTDGLSRPFPLGGGDIMTSLVALTFYKHLVLAPRCGWSLPSADWSGDGAVVPCRTNDGVNEPVREFLERELAARRMVAASLAQTKEQARLLAERIARAPEVAKAIDSATLDGYAGEYEPMLPGVPALSVSRVQGGLYIQTPGEPAVELLALSQTRFFIVVGTDVYDMEFIVDGSNQASALVVTVYGQAFVERRK